MKLFYFGANIQVNMLDIVNTEIDSVVIYERSNSHHVAKILAEMEQHGRAFSIDRPIIATSRDGFEFTFLDDRDRILRAVLSDFKVFLLRSRFLRFDLGGAFEGFTYFADIVDFAIKLTGGRRPEVVFCSYTPHTVESWIIVRTLEELGARIVRLIDSPLPWVALPVKGLINGPNCNLVSAARPLRSYAIDEYLAKLRGEYAIAMPYYERPVARSLTTGLVSLIRQLHPREMLMRLEWISVQKEFKTAAVPIPDRAVFGVYFLHYQPEMNTLPEADVYCDQFQAVSKLAAALPEGITLIVKEHPSTFAKHCDRRWRPKGFYARFLSLPNVRVCPSETGAFELIDRAIFVASIAGVCLTEALARGKPAVCFFTPRFSDFFKDVVIDANRATHTQLQESFLAIAKGELSVDRHAFRASLERLMEAGYDGALDHTYLPNSAAETAENSIRATCLAIRDVISGSL